LARSSPVRGPNPTGSPPKFSRSLPAGPKRVNNPVGFAPRNQPLRKIA